MSPYSATGHFDRAIDLLERTLADRTHILGPDHPDNRGLERHHRQCASSRRFTARDHPHRPRTASRTTSRPTRRALQPALKPVTRVFVGRAGLEPATNGL
ncbi:tetratricopeptide repeat protein [Nocardia takedensis]|uniref:tetratricopeptide repeat protein n=1 Tax=Nocardia takedensis TaxID=259390 RepID=UPI003F7573B4